MYLKIKGNQKKYYVTLQYFKTQHGKDAVRFIGEDIPETDKGFIYYDDDDKVFADLSDYVYQYKPNEYSVEEDVIQEGHGNDEPLPPSVFDNINSRINSVNNRVNHITPYTESKQLYIGDTDTLFPYVPQGLITASILTESGEYVPFTMERSNDEVVFTFEELQELATITISVQLQ